VRKMKNINFNNIDIDEYKEENEKLNKLVEKH
jgi:hypothetical protein